MCLLWAGQINLLPGFSAKRRPCEFPLSNRGLSTKSENDVITSYHGFSFDILEQNNNSHIPQIYSFGCKYTQLDVNMSEICTFGPKYSEIMERMPRSIPAQIKTNLGLFHVTGHVGQRPLVS